MAKNPLDEYTDTGFKTRIEEMRSVYQEETRSLTALTGADATSLNDAAKVSLMDTVKQMGFKGKDLEPVAGFVLASLALEDLLNLPEVRATVGDNLSGRLVDSLMRLGGMYIDALFDRAEVEDDFKEVIEKGYL